MIWSHSVVLVFFLGNCTAVAESVQAICNKRITNVYIIIKHTREIYICLLVIQSCMLYINIKYQNYIKFNIILNLLKTKDLNYVHM